MAVLHRFYSIIFAGFGHELAKRLDEHGCIVFASCLHPGKNGASELKRTTSRNVHILPLDVGSDKSVTAALQYVQKHCPHEGVFLSHTEGSYTQKACAKNMLRFHLNYFDGFLKNVQNSCGEAMLIFLNIMLTGMGVASSPATCRTPIRVRHRMSFSLIYSIQSIFLSFTINKSVFGNSVDPNVICAYGTISAVIGFSFPIISLE